MTGLIDGSRKLSLSLPLASSRIRPFSSKFCRILLISVGDQKGMACSSLLSVSSVQRRRSRSREGCCNCSSLSTCSITVSSSPMVAARVGDISKGRSGIRDELMSGCYHKAASASLRRETAITCMPLMACFGALALGTMARVKPCLAASCNRC